MLGEVDIAGQVVVGVAGVRAGIRRSETLLPMASGALRETRSTCCREARAGIATGRLRRWVIFDCITIGGAVRQEKCCPAGVLSGRYSGPTRGGTGEALCVGTSFLGACATDDGCRFCRSAAPRAGTTSSGGEMQENMRMPFVRRAKASQCAPRFWCRHLRALGAGIAEFRVRGDDVLAVSRR